jgi:hypothetical protein
VRCPKTGETVFEGEDTMKITIGLAAAVAATSLLSGCYDQNYGGGPGYGPGPLALADCGGFYDDFYGPFDDGCWGDDGVFWYRGRDHAFHRDNGGHFRHAGGPGMHEVHGVGPGAGAHFGGGGGHRG